MAIDKLLISGNTTLLILKLLDEKDMYGYEMIEQLAKRSDNTFSLKAGTLYPLLHGFEEKNWVMTYEDSESKGRTRKYYSITDDGRKILKNKTDEWKEYSAKINLIIDGGIAFGV